MRFIGITGGVGAGKSAVLDYLNEDKRYMVLLADEVAHDLMEPGTKCYDRLKKEFLEEDIYLPAGGFDRNKLAQVIFSDDDKRKRLNEIVHPSVKEFVIETVEKAQKEGIVSIVFFEAALLIEEKYYEICDELWYIYTSEDNRRKRLKENRGYTDEKIDNIFDSQLKDEQFRQYCQVIIDNNGSIDDTRKQVDLALSTDKE
ncbi:MAG: dephospho-CoA kinase [Agathobacter sp.]|nr:dephospho-CoA kinase [Agathobacter sp.]